MNIIVSVPPSGVWKGVYSFFGKDQLIEVGLNFKPGTVDGTGIDNISPFDVSGVWSHLNLENQLRVSFEKTPRNNLYSIKPTFYSGVITEENGRTSMIGFYSEKREGVHHHEKFDFDLTFEGTFEEVRRFRELKYLGI